MRLVYGSLIKSNFGGFLQNLEKIVHLLFTHNFLRKYKFKETINTKAANNIPISIEPNYMYIKKKS